MTFHNVRFPTDISFGSAGGPERRTEIVSLVNGFEERNSPWAQSRRRFDAGLGLRNLDDVATVLAFFEARQGKLYGFRWKDWSDHKSCLPSAQVSALDQTLGQGDGVQVAFQLVKTYVSGSQSTKREISKPIAQSLRVAVDGAELPQDDFSVDDQTGIITLGAAPAASATVTAGFEFDVPVRFDTDRIVVSAAGFDAGEIPDIPVVELRQ